MWLNNNNFFRDSDSYYRLFLFFFVFNAMGSLQLRYLTTSSLLVLVLLLLPDAIKNTYALHKDAQ